MSHFAFITVPSNRGAYFIDTVRRIVREFVKEYKPALGKRIFSQEHRDDAEYMLGSLRQDDARLSSYILYLLYGDCITSSITQEPVAEIEAFLKGEDIPDISETVLAYHSWHSIYHYCSIKQQSMEDLFVLCNMIRERVRRTMVLDLLLGPVDETKVCEE